MSKNLKINSLESEHRHVACSVQKYVCMSVYGMFYRGNISLLPMALQKPTFTTAIKVKIFWPFLQLDGE